MTEAVLNLRITLAAPPAGVMFSLQKGDDTPVDARLSNGGDLSLDVGVKVAEGADGLRFLGPFVRREGQRRFVYFRVGTSAGQHDSPWSRRGKVFLTDIPEALVRTALADGARLEARFAGKARDGGPACATVRPIADWRRMA